MSGRGFRGVTTAPRGTTHFAASALLFGQTFLEGRDAVGGRGGKDEGRSRGGRQRARDGGGGGRSIDRSDLRRCPLGRARNGRVRGGRRVASRTTTAGRRRRPRARPSPGSASRASGRLLLLFSIRRGAAATRGRLVDAAARPAAYFRRPPRAREPNARRSPRDASVDALARARARERRARGGSVRSPNGERDVARCSLRASARTRFRRRRRMMMSARTSEGDLLDDETRRAPAKPQLIVDRARSVSS
jgi:hypothetical protein